MMHVANGQRTALESNVDTYSDGMWHYVTVTKEGRKYALDEPGFLLAAECMLHIHDIFVYFIRFWCIDVSVIFQHIPSLVTPAADAAAADSTDAAADGAVQSAVGHR